MALDRTRYRRRKAASALMAASCVAASVLGLAILGAILATLLIKGMAGLTPAVFTEMTPPPGSDGGLLNAIVGSFIMSFVAVAAGTPIGILAGTYMAEYGRHSKVSSIIRFVNDILLSAPSIVIGLFIYELMVRPLGHFSALAGAAALAVLVIPIVVRTTENMLLLVPDSLREAASALGMPRSLIVRNVAYKAARAGIITGVLLAIARISGETAPLLFTALNNQFWSLNLNAPMASLPAIIFQYALSPYEDWQRLAWTGALLITAAVLTISIVARWLGTSRSPK
jgi:phosphate transport system permease protein